MYGPAAYELGDPFGAGEEGLEEAWPLSEIKTKEKFCYKSNVLGELFLHRCPKLKFLRAADGRANFPPKYFYCPQTGQINFN